MFEESVSAIPSIWASMNSWFTPTVLFVLLNLMIGTIAITSSFGTQKQSDQQHQQQQQQPQPQQLARSPSVLQRLKSINLYSYRSPESTTRTFHNQTHQETETHFAFPETPPQPQLTGSPSVLERLRSINLYNYISQETLNPLHETRETESHFQEQQEEHTPEVEQREEEEEEEEKEEIQDEEQTFDEIYSKLKGHRTYSDTKPASGEIPTKLPKKMKKSASAKSAFAHFEEEDIVEARRPATVRERKPKVTEVDDEVDAKADDFINKFKQQLKLQRIDSIIRYKEMVGRDTGK
ncbi:hypothetical protein HS088_TW09G01258 [Tripterygium wilfordii]|uniref:DUF4408 domain-containing protein n=1 Tax=Tripterygium wilfordii TaxID=458696 RepID=A0A7J7DA22_TRIWF|nr:pathogen-associated molecular patterns-induced protein A70-like [Tripterygium wilfordii]KAF5743193.1 hypothetical protein HS088_TW09G01258 [Tripterygium wilfordii]